ncbi:unnamed protein product [Rotaria sordida]|uniref:Uncharacterized protein n=1 Tax=Rotaria sordida TaxID=392033 RepID=A0A814Z371_9BILA|nr:unnamed protein product [Rotaria sordida]
MPYLHTFIFNIITKNVKNDQELLRTSDDIQRTFIKRGYNVNCYIDRYSQQINQCHVYSPPFTMKYMCNVANNFVGDLFMSVRQLQLYDFFIPFEHDFFARHFSSFSITQCIKRSQSSWTKEEVDTSTK